MVDRGGDVGAAEGPRLAEQRGGSTGRRIAAAISGGGGESLGLWGSPEAAASFWGLWGGPEAAESPGACGAVRRRRRVLGPVGRCGCASGHYGGDWRGGSSSRG